MSDFLFTITNATGDAVTTVAVSADDIREWRAVDENRFASASGWNDKDIAYDIYEQRYESALDKLGITYDEAHAQGFTVTVTTS